MKTPAWKSVRPKRPQNGWDAIKEQKQLPFHCEKSDDERGKEQKKLMSDLLMPDLSTSVRGLEVLSAIDATVLREDVLKRNGEEHLFDKIMELAVHAEDELPMIFGWKNVEVFVQHQEGQISGLYFILW